MHSAWLTWRQRAVEIDERHPDRRLGEGPVEARLRIAQLALDGPALRDVGDELGAGLQQPADEQRDQQRRERGDHEPGPREPAPGGGQRRVELASGTVTTTRRHGVPGDGPLEMRNDAPR